MRNPEIVAAILAGSCMLSAAVYFGLRSAPPGASPVAPVVPAATSVASQATTAQPEPPPTAAPPPQTDRKALEAAVAKAIDALKPAMVSDCLAPSVARKKDPARVRYTWNGTIGPGGIPLSSGLSENRAENRPDVSPCVRQKLATLRAPGAGEGFVEVPFTLP